MSAAPPATGTRTIMACAAMGIASTGAILWTRKIAVGAGKKRRRAMKFRNPETGEVFKEYTLDEIIGGADHA